MPSSHLILCRPLLLLPSIPPSIKVFSNESTLRMRWPKYWSFSFSISPSNEYSGLISFRIDWLDLLAVQGTLKRLLQHHSSKASILQCSAFFMVQLSQPYMTIGKTIALTRWPFVSAAFVASAAPPPQAVMDATIAAVSVKAATLFIVFFIMCLYIRWPKYWSFSFNIRPSNEHLGLISFKMNWLDLLAVQGTLKSLLQHRSSKASILPHSAFFTV